LKYKYSPPILAQKIFSDFIWKTSNDKILLTFDDGPTDEVTLKILNVLNSNQIKAVFFCVGNNITRYLHLTEKILEDGHTIANHTMNHRLLTEMKKDESIDEILPFNKELNEKFNFRVKYFRPPHGKFNLRTKKLLNEMNLRCVMWNLLTYDFQNDFNVVKHSIDNYLRKDSIIVFHDNKKCSNIIEQSLIYTIKKATMLGFEFGEPENCLN
jgi:peptidoglycan/xylan/chitin deacetylase (PgdA/CDA1 family)